MRYSSIVLVLARRMHQRLVAHGESIAMMRGEEPELLALNRQLRNITAERQRQIRAQMKYDAGSYYFHNYLPVMITNTCRLSWSSTTPCIINLSRICFSLLPSAPIYRSTVATCVCPAP